MMDKIIIILLLLLKIIAVQMSSEGPSRGYGCILVGVLLYGRIKDRLCSGVVMI